MFRFGRIHRGDLDQVLASQLTAEVTYTEIGATRTDMPVGYRHDEHAIDLGSGGDVFVRAVDGLRRWEAHRRAGLTLLPDRPDLKEGATLVLAKMLPGLSAIAACRIVYAIEEFDTFGFAYGTLPLHPEQGEEAFMVRRHPNDTVTFAITAFSRPRHPLARLGGPITRRIQQETTEAYLKELRAYAAG